jgi:prepilin signal peptidase PulO-like enzyme (type II secretory pathway)
VRSARWPGGRSPVQERRDSMSAPTEPIEEPVSVVPVAETPTDTQRPNLRAAAVGVGVALAAGCFAAFGLSAYATLAAFYCAVLLAVTVTDIERRIIPNRIVLPATAVVLVAHTAIDPSFEWVLGALGGSAFLFVAALVSPGGMGMGDVKLALLIGGMLGLGVAAALGIASVLALVPSLLLLVRHGRAARKMAFAFGPFLAAGGLIILFTGSPF